MSPGGFPTRAASLPRRRSLQLAAAVTVWVSGLLAAIAWVVLAVTSLRKPVVSFDTLVVIQTVDSALAHLRKGQLQHWEGAYSLLQAIPAFALRAAGQSRPDTINVLVGVNVVSVLAMVGIAWFGLRRRSRAGAFLLVAVLLSGALLWYLHASFGEPLAAAVTLAAVAAAWNSRRNLGVAALLVLAGLSKDTAVPFLLVLALGASVGSPQWASRSFRIRRVAALILGAAASLAVAAAYNYARFGSPIDVPYLAPILYVPSLEIQLNFLAAIWLAPNGGLLPYWPSFGLLLLLCAMAAVGAVRVAPDRGGRLARLAPAAAVAVTLLGMSLVLSRWLAPLGWVAWGPRLILPWVPAWAYLLVAAYAGELERLLARLTRSPVLFLLLAVALAAASVPQYVAMVHPKVWLLVFATDAQCPIVPTVNLGSYYYRCTEHQMWSKPSMLAAAYAPGADPTPLLIACACAAALIWLLHRMRAAALRTPSLPSPQGGGTDLRRKGTDLRRN